MKNKLIGLAIITLLSLGPTAQASEGYLNEVVPITLSISSVGIRAPLVELGLGKNGELELPDNRGVAGWFGGGPKPHEIGPTVIAGRVDWKGAKDEFWNLDRVQVGDKIVVRSVSKLVLHIATFQVTAVNLYRKSEFPTDLVYGNLTYNGLRVITDGGFDVSKGSYEGNLIVFARISSETVLF